MSKSIYSKGFIYERARNRYHLDIEHLKHELTKLPVLNSHNFKEGEDVTGKYEKNHQQLMLTGKNNWQDCDKDLYDVLNEKFRRIVAIALNQSVQEVEIKLDRSTLPKDGQYIDFQTQDEDWHEGYFVEGDDLFWVNESKWYPAFDILKWKAK